MSRNPGTGVDIFIDGAPYWNSTPYSLTEDATPLTPDDMGGGVSQVTFAVMDQPGEIVPLISKRFSFTDGSNGELSGIIRGASGTGVTATLVADSVLAKLNVTRTVAPYPASGTANVLSYIQHLLSTCGVTETVEALSGASGASSAYPGFSGNILDAVKKLCVANQLELAYVSNKIILRKPRGIQAETYRDSDSTWAIDDSSLSRRVEGVYRDKRADSSVAYPVDGWSSDLPIYTVDANEVVELDLEVNASLRSIVQPGCVSSMTPETSTSSYVVVGNDGFPIPPAQWYAWGGAVTVEIGDDTRSLSVRIQGPTEDKYAPYRLAMSSGDGNYYSALVITGSGVFWAEETISLPACLNEDRVAEDSSITVDNEMYPSRDAFLHGLLWAASRHTSPLLKITANANSINQLGATGTQRHFTIAEFASAYPGYTISTLPATLGPTIAAFNQVLKDRIDALFDRQAFGNIGGAMVKREGFYCDFRIRSATITPISVQYDAEMDATIAGRAAARPTQTIAQFNSTWSGKKVADFDLAPYK